MRVLLILPMASLILAGCAPTLRVKEKPRTLAICPIYSMDEDSLVIREFDRRIAEFTKQDSSFLKTNTCDTAHAKLNVHFDRTGIPSNGDRAVRYSVSAIGIAAPFILLAMEAPIWIGAIWIPANQTKIMYELVGVTAEKNNVRGVSSTTSFYGSREHHINKQGREVIKNIEKQIEAVKASE